MIGKEERETYPHQFTAAPEEMTPEQSLNRLTFFMIELKRNDDLKVYRTAWWKLPESQRLAIVKRLQRNFKLLDASIQNKMFFANINYMNNQHK